MDKFDASVNALLATRGRPKLAFFDIDGTLQNSAGAVGESTSRELKRLSERGFHLSIASGRPYFAAKELIKKLGINAPSIFYSGALVINPDDARVLSKVSLSSNDLKKIIDIAKSYKLYAELYTETEYFSNEVNSFTKIHEFYLNKKAIITPFSDLIAREQIIKVEFVAKTGSDEQKISEATEKLKEFNISRATGASHPEINFVNITSKEILNLDPFKLVIKQLNLRPEESLAFGDSPSDIEAIKAAGIGIAMGNAHPELKAVADFITLSVDEDGVGQFLKAICLSV